MQERSLESPQPVSMTDETARSAAIPSPRHAELAQLAADIDGSARMTEQRVQIAQLKGISSGLSTSSPGKRKKPALQGKFSGAGFHAAPMRRPAGSNGLPAQLKQGIEALSGMAMDHVRVHYNSPQPAQLQAHAYAQGADIHLAAGQDRHLPHEAWHVVQQAQGRVKPTLQMKDGVAVNDSAALEAEADVMGARALGAGRRAQALPGAAGPSSNPVPAGTRSASLNARALPRQLARPGFRGPARAASKAYRKTSGGPFDLAHRLSYADIRDHVENGDKKSITNLIIALTIPKRNFGAIRAGNKVYFQAAMSLFSQGDYGQLIKQLNSSPFNLRPGKVDVNRSNGRRFDGVRKPGLKRALTPQSAELEPFAMDTTGQDSSLSPQDTKDFEAHIDMD